MTALNQRIRALCQERGLQFRPWEVRPWEVTSGPSPYRPGTAGADAWPKAQKLRTELIAELKAPASESAR